MNSATAFALAINIHNAATCHKRTCEENCTVSLTLLHEAALQLVNRWCGFTHQRQFAELVWPL